jgi:two-component system, OmpR family, response regulator
MRILLVEDDARLSASLAGALREAGFAVDIAADGITAEHLGAHEPYDAAVLDLGLPKRSGIEVLSNWRSGKRTLPVLILTARDAWSDKVEGFRAGADDFPTKPFKLEEVLLRLRALIRRASGHANPVLRAGALEFDTQHGTFLLDGMPLKLTAFEWRVLSYLMHQSGRTVSRTELSQHAYEDHVDRDHNSIEVIIGRIRKKIGREVIATERGVGYRLAAERDDVVA